ncbi:NepR family anti-sigma factor [Sphingomonas sp. DT-204]|uniref:NepR family anti-sigma factor n=1 Tax=Sphingomonas sp. DT-204 TaxID=3396166 RepID=UPI003F1E1ADA
MRSEKTDSDPKMRKKGERKQKRDDRSVGEALRAVYQDAVSENIPDEMLDLLNKLG